MYMLIINRHKTDPSKTMLIPKSLLNSKYSCHMSGENLLTVTIFAMFGKNHVLFVKLYHFCTYLLVTIVIIVKQNGCSLIHIFCFSFLFTPEYFSKYSLLRKIKNFQVLFFESQWWCSYKKCWVLCCL